MSGIPDPTQAPAGAAQRRRRPLGVVLAILGALAVVILAVLVALLLARDGGALADLGDAPDAGESPSAAPPPTFRAPAPTVTAEDVPEEPAEEDPEEQVTSPPAQRSPQQPPPPVIHYFRVLPGTTPVDCTGNDQGVGGDVEWSASNVLDHGGVLLKGVSSDPFSLPLYTGDLPATGSSGVYVDCAAHRAPTTYTLLFVDLYGREATATLTFDRHYD